MARSPPSPCPWEALPPVDEPSTSGDQSRDCSDVGGRPNCKPAQVSPRRASDASARWGARTQSPRRAAQSLAHPCRHDRSPGWHATGRNKIPSGGNAATWPASETSGTAHAKADSKRQPSDRVVAEARAASIRIVVDGPPGTQAGAQACSLKWLLGEEVRAIVGHEIRAALAEHAAASGAAFPSDSSELDPRPVVVGQEPEARQSRLAASGDALSSGDLDLEPRGPAESEAKPSAFDAQEAARSRETAAVQSLMAIEHRAMRLLERSLIRDGSANERQSELHAFIEQFFPSYLQYPVSVVFRCLYLFGTLRAPKRDDCASRFVDGNPFKMLIALVITLNCVFMTWAVDYEIQNYMSRPTQFMMIVEGSFLAFYGLELFLKLHRYRWYYFCDASWMYNWLDLALVLSSTYSLLLADHLGGTTWIRVLRTLKLARVLRIVKLAATFAVLRNILGSLACSFPMFLWSCVLLATLLFMFSLAFVQRIAYYFQAMGTSLDPDVRESLTEAFGSVPKAMTSLYMCTTGGQDWLELYEPLLPTGVLNQALFLFFISFTQIAILNVILGIFVDRAMKEVSVPAEELVLDHVVLKRKFQEELEELCKRADTDCDGQITISDWHLAHQKGQLGAYLDMMGLREEHVEEIFEALLKDGENSVDIDRFVRGCIRMKGNASSFDLNMALAEMRVMTRSMEEHHRQVQRTLAELRRAL